MYDKTLCLKYFNIVNKDGIKEDDFLGQLELSSLEFKDSGQLDEDNYNLALTYKSMHELVLSNNLSSGNNLESVVDGVHSEKVGDIEVIYNDRSTSNDYKSTSFKNYYNSTKYGIKFYNIISTNIIPLMCSTYDGI